MSTPPETLSTKGSLSLAQHQHLDKVLNNPELRQEAKTNINLAFKVLERERDTSKPVSPISAKEQEALEYSMALVHTVDYSSANEQKKSQVNVPLFREHLHQLHTARSQGTHAQLSKKEWYQVLGIDKKQQKDDHKRLIYASLNTSLPQDIIGGGSQALGTFVAMLSTEAGALHGVGSALAATATSVMEHQASLLHACAMDQTQGMNLHAVACLDSAQRYVQSYLAVYLAEHALKILNDTPDISEERKRHIVDFLAKTRLEINDMESKMKFYKHTDMAKKVRLAIDLMGQAIQTGISVLGYQYCGPAAPLCSAPFNILIASATNSVALLAEKSLNTRALASNFDGLMGIGGQAHCDDVVRSEAAKLYSLSSEKEHATLLQVGVHKLRETHEEVHQALKSWACHEYISQHVRSRHHYEMFLKEQRLYDLECLYAERLQYRDALFARDPSLREQARMHVQALDASIKSLESDQQSNTMPLEKKHTRAAKRLEHKLAYIQQQRSVLRNELEQLKSRESHILLNQVDQEVAGWIDQAKILAKQYQNRAEEHAKYFDALERELYEFSAGQRPKPGSFIAQMIAYPHLRERYVAQIIRKQTNDIGLITSTGALHLIADPISFVVWGEAGESVRELHGLTDEDTAVTLASISAEAAGGAAGLSGDMVSYPLLDASLETYGSIIEHPKISTNVSQDRLSEKAKRHWGMPNSVLRQGDIDHSISIAPARMPLRRPQATAPETLKQKIANQGHKLSSYAGDAYATLGSHVVHMAHGAHHLLTRASERAKHGNMHQRTQKIDARIEQELHTHGQASQQISAGMYTTQTMNQMLEQASIHTFTHPEHHITIVPKICKASNIDDMQDIHDSLKNVSDRLKPNEHHEVRVMFELDAKTQSRESGRYINVFYTVRRNDQGIPSVTYDMIDPIQPKKDVYLPQIIIFQARHDASFKNKIITPVLEPIDDKRYEAFESFPLPIHGQSNQVSATASYYNILLDTHISDQNEGGIAQGNHAPMVASQRNALLNKRLKSNMDQLDNVRF